MATTSLVLVDNGYGTLGSALATGDTTLTFTAGHGARFPAVASGQMLSCCILNANNVLEEVQVTLHTAGADTATMVRGANGTTAKAWNAGDRVEARVSSDVLKRLQVEAMKEITIATADAGATYTGSISPTGYGLVSGLVYAFKLTTTNSVVAPTINLSSLGAVTVKLDGGGALLVGSMPLNGLYKYDGTNFILLNPVPVTGTFTATLTGMTGSVTGTAAYSINSNVVTLFLPIMTGTSNTTAMTATGAPAAIFPTTAHLGFPCVMEDNTTVSGGAGRADVGTNGVVTFYTNLAAGGFTNSGTKGLPTGMTITYNLN